MEEVCCLTFLGTVTSLSSEVGQVPALTPSCLEPGMWPVASSQVLSLSRLAGPWSASQQRPSRVSQPLPVPCHSYGNDDSPRGPLHRGEWAGQSERDVGEGPHSPKTLSS